MSILEINNLKTHFAQRQGFLRKLAGKEPDYIRAVDGVDLDLDEGEVLGIVGESGCGKSTLSRTILKLIKSTSGSMRYRGTEISDMPESDFKPYRRKMQMIFQDPFGSLNPRRKVAEILGETIDIHELAENQEERKQMIEKSLSEVGLDPPGEFWEKYPGLLSGGQLQRVSMARVLILQPDFVVADEPVSMLDVSVRIGILDLLLQLRKKYSISFIYITHDLATARYVCDRINIMYLGRFVESGTTETILKKPAHPYTRALISAVPVPNPDVGAPELPIKGYVNPEGLTDITGCRFAPRCPYTEEACKREEPECTSIYGSGKQEHRIACRNLAHLPEFVPRG
ncbi:MAG: ABC transporter ATP-binding protein [Spirochaetales bacterium]|nr:ABC transporter ATP-binding protein [Spirochaetales bacterium]MCF7937404.1 ABC transporter ATP-binding protein [Spirochaetales bacterium]